MEWRKIGKITVIAAGIYLMFRFLLPFLLPILLAVLLVKLVRAFVKLADRYLHLKKTAAAILFCGGLLVLLLFFAYRLILYISDQGVRFAGYCQENYPYWQREMRDFCCDCDRYLGLRDGTLHRLVQNGVEDVLRQAEEYLTERLPERLVQAAASCAGVFVTITVIGMASLLLYQDYEAIREELYRQKWFCRLARLRETVSHAGLAYLKAQGIIIGCVLLYNAVGLHLLGYKNTFFIGLLIGIVDFLPVLGSGTVLLPWMFLQLLSGSYGTVVGIFVIYLLCSFTRQYLEPRLMGKRNGIRPFYMFLCIYLGVRLFGLWGVFLGPFGVILATGIYREWSAAEE